MKALETIGEIIAGLFIGLITLVVLLVGSLFAVGSLGRVLKTKSM